MKEKKNYQQKKKNINETISVGHPCNVLQVAFTNIYIYRENYNIIFHTFINIFVIYNTCNICAIRPSLLEENISYNILYIVCTRYNSRNINTPNGLYTVHVRTRKCKKKNKQKTTNWKETLKTMFFSSFFFKKKKSLQLCCVVCCMCALLLRSSQSKSFGLLFSHCVPTHWFSRVIL